MPQIFGSGEIAQRLRRLLDFRGRFPGQIDEMVVPTVNVADAHRPPYRVSGRRWYTGGIIEGAVAGTAGAWVGNNSLSATPSPQGAIVTIDRIYAWGASASEVGGTRAFIGTRTSIPSAVTAQYAAQTSEGARPPEAGVGDSGIDELPITFYASEPVGSQLATTLQWLWLPNVASGAGVNGVAGMPAQAVNYMNDNDGFVLAPGMWLGLEWTTQAGTNILVVSFSGQYFDDVRRLAR